jgi:DNA-cytosine methyltransferase
MGNIVVRKSNWSLNTANDQKHRLQIKSTFSSTVRREWNRFPQEAHILDIENSIYRRLTIEEICKIQTFPVDYFHQSNMKPREIIAGLGNAVAPDLSKIILENILSKFPTKNKTTIDICAGIGGLSLGVPISFEHICLIDFWKPSIEFLKLKKNHWEEKNVFYADIKDFDFGKYKNETGLLIGGPPCQPYSNAGLRQGEYDERDLMAYTPKIINQVLPEIFILENVPGLISPKFNLYFTNLIKSLSGESNDFNYGVSYQVFNTLDFNIAQSRKRVFIVGIKNVRNFEVADLLNSIKVNRISKIKTLNEIGVGETNSTDEWFEFNGELEYYKLLDKKMQRKSNQLELFNLL